MTRLRSAGRLALAAALHGIVWLIELGTTPVDDDDYVDKTRALGESGRTTRAYRTQDIDE